MTRQALVQSFLYPVLANGVLSYVLSCCHCQRYIKLCTNYFLISPETLKIIVKGLFSPGLCCFGNSDNSTGRLTDICVYPQYHIAMSISYCAFSGMKIWFYVIILSLHTSVICYNIHVFICNITTVSMLMFSLYKCQVILKVPFY